MAMIETVESPEDIERLLHDAKRKLQVFEDGVDNPRLLERLRTSSAMHPLLVLRGGTLVVALLLVLGALVVPVAALLNDGIARAMAPFDGAVPLPAFFPDNLGLPALLLASALLMIFAWFMASQAALSMGRDAQMLPWEAREHQKLMNDVTRLTTQKAVMERTRSTPGGARPRIATPVPVSMRERGRMAGSTGGLGGGLGGGLAGGGTNPYGGGLSIPPSDLMGGGAPAPRRAVAELGDYRAPNVERSTGGLRGPPTHNSTPPGPRPGGGLGLAVPPPGLARPATPKSMPPGGLSRPKTLESMPPQLGKGLGGPSRSPSYPSAQSMPPGPFRGPGGATGGSSFPPSGGLSGGLMSRARPAGGTPRPAPSRPSFPPMAPSAPPGPSPFAGLGRPTSGSGDPLKPRIGGESLSTGPRLAPSCPPVAVEDLSDALDFSDPDQTLHDERNVDVRGRAVKLAAPTSDRWLRDVVERSRAFASLLPPQIRLEYNQEEGVPFTLVMSRATPAMAIRAMMQFSDFLSGIPTPPATRVELSSVGNLDRTFASNVATSLDRHFPSGYLLESEPGQINILFNEPDVVWEGVAEVPVPAEE